MLEDWTVRPTDLDAFHRLVQDDHVRCYLFDGHLLPRSWTAERVQQSQALFERRGVGIWLAYERKMDEALGFCGFLEFPTMHLDPQLVYAMFERFSGNWTWLGIKLMQGTQNGACLTSNERFKKWLNS